MLKFKLNVAERKTLAKRMEELTGIHPYYTKAPLYSQIELGKEDFQGVEFTGRGDGEADV